MTDHDDPPASELIDAAIDALGDWRGQVLALVRDLIRRAEPQVVETVKWRTPSNPRGVPVWERAGIVCTGEVYRDKVKITFARGASLDDPAGLCNASLTGTTRRAIDLHEADSLDEEGFVGLVRAAVARNERTAEGDR